LSPALRFPNPASLRAALLGDLIPADVQERPMRWEQDGEGLVIQGEPIAAERLEALAKLGVQPITQSPQRAGLCWAQALPLRPVDPVSRGWFLITSPHQDAIQRLLTDAVTLGCQTLLVRYGEPNALRIMDPPYYLVLRAQESSELTVFHQRRDGHWQETGWSHPCPTIQASGSSALRFYRDQRWDPVPTDNWLELNEAVRVQVEQREPTRSHAPQSPIPIPLRLSPKPNGNRARLWLLPYDQLSSFERWTAALSQQQLQGIQFAILGSDGTKTIALRADHHLEAPGDSIAYTPLDDDGTIYLPLNTALSPPLSIEQLNQVLQQEADDLLWIEDGQPHARAERVSRQAFRPLSDWVSYVIDTHQEPIITWMKGVDPLLSPTQKGPAPQPSPEETPPSPPDAAPAQPAATAPETKRAPTPTPAARRSAPPTAQIAHAPPIKGALLQLDEAQLAGALEPIESRLREQPTDPALWLQLATVQAQANLETEAIQSLSRAWWDLPPAEQQVSAKQWHQDLAGDATATWSAAIAGLPTDGADDWLEAHGPGLDARSVWLARRALVASGQCDALALQEEKDGLLRRIQHGLSPARDLPCCLLDEAHSLLTRLTRIQALRALQRFFLENPRTPHPGEAHPPNTERLVGHILCCGYSVLGAYDAAQEALSATPGPGQESPLLRLLEHTYRERADLALAGRPATTALQSAPDLQRSLSSIERYHYGQALDRSAILAPLSLMDPQQGWIQGRATDQPPEVQLRLLIGEGLSINTLLGARQREALDQLRALVDSLDPAKDLRHCFRAYVCAAAWERPALAATAASAIRQGIPAATPQALQRLARELPVLLSIGQTSEAEELLARIDTALPESNTKLFIHAGLAVAGFDNQALALAEESVGLLAAPLAIGDRLFQIRGICEALRYQDIADSHRLLSELSGQLTHIRDNGISNAYYSAAAIEFSECLVLAIAGRPPVGNPKLLDEEESEFRRQLDQDTRTL
jgi:hypothetical protein